MRTDLAPQPTRLSNYSPTNFEIESVFLSFDLHTEATHVQSRLKMKRISSGPLELDGEDISLLSIKLDGQALKRSDYRLTQTQLILNDCPESFLLEINTRCNPSENSKLMGLYLSGGRFCTQCEAEGFRRITYYPDRPDVMSVFTVRIEADKASYPYLLANGNPTEQGDLGKGRHYAIWHDPFPKPCYLFALVAGEFDRLEDHFITQSGRNIPLTIYVDPGDANRVSYAMDALKRSMKWDEEEYGREYDLDRFMIVAVRDFNFGAMENKGLNIFNSALLISDEKTATDLNYERIESVVAHEYFHNWTGNRITCRDWFQLCLKEGFTVFRDQEFSASQRGATVQRIKDVRALRSRQFPEDAGPLAHPVRPDHYMTIDNFYTATVYEKGAELIRMLKTFLGADMFRQGCDYYFKSLDGTAATVEEFIDCFEHVSQQNLSKFMRWYHEAGTPRVKLTTQRTPTRFDIHCSQTTPPTPGQPTKTPKLIPMKWQLVYDNGQTSEPFLDILQTPTHTISAQTSYNGHVSLSAFQDFSAPIILETDYTRKDLSNLMRCDPNGFNRWEAGQTLARNLLVNLSDHISRGEMPAADPSLKAYIAALKDTLLDTQFDDAFKALLLTPPSENEILQYMTLADPIAIHEARNLLLRAIADGLRPFLIQYYNSLAQHGPFSASPESAGKRALRNRCLNLLADRLDPQAASFAQLQFETATNMTNELAALLALMRLGGRRVDHSIQRFYEKWRHDPLVTDKWFMIAASRKSRDSLKSMQLLLEHKDYTPKNPNRVRALLAGFARNNPTGFHHISGHGYRFFTQQICEIDGRNPALAAFLAGIYESWPKFDLARQTLIRSELSHILDQNPSKNLSEIATKLLG